MKDATIRHSRTVWTCNTTSRLRHQKTAGRRPRPGMTEPEGAPAGRAGSARRVCTTDVRESNETRHPPRAADGRDMRVNAAPWTAAHCRETSPTT